MSWSDEVLAKLAAFDRHVRETATRAEIPDADRAPSVEIEPFARFPAHVFDYLAELDALEADDPATSEQLLDEVAGFFRGALRSQSPYCLFNIMPLPTSDATAAACLAMMHNPNGLMDAFAGEALLVEQKVARTVGRWAGWTEAMGIACTSGKMTMQYALRCAIARVRPDAARSGITGRLVVLCSAGAHYSIEHVAAAVGIGADNCVRVPQDASGAMSPRALRAELERLHAEGATVAAVICAGGTTIDFCCDDTAATLDVVDDFVRRHRLDARPYLHVDGVIGWLYLSCSNLDAPALASAIADPDIRRRIAEVLRRLAALPRFDSMGADFHKNGLCPHASSFFVAKDRGFMDVLGTGYAYTPKDFRLGAFRAYRYTFENSRPLHGVLSAWVNLRKLGRRGFQEHLISLHRARAGLEAALERQGAFAVLNRGTLGWEVIVDIPLTARDALTPRDRAIAFMRHCWARISEGHELPLFSIVAGYGSPTADDAPAAGFLLYPVREQPDDVWDAVVGAIARERERFLAEGPPTTRATSGSGFQAPVR